MRPSTSPIAIWAGILVLYLVWGSTYLGIKVAVGTLPPFVLGFVRFVPAGILLTAAIAFRYRATIRRPTLAETRDAAIVGAFLLVGGVGLVTWGEQTMPSGIAALMIALMPMWLAIFGRVLLGERLPRAATAGIAVGLAGVAILAWPVDGVGPLDPAGFIAILASPMLWALGSLYAARRAVLPAPGLFASGIEMIAAGGLFLGLSLVTGELPGFDWGSVSAISWAGVVYLAIVGSLIGYTTYAWLLGVAPLPRIATYAYVNPIVAVFLGWLLLGEPLTPRTAVAAAVIVAAVALIVTARGRTAPRAAEAVTRVDAAVPAPEPASGA